jgi:ketosteroid isomerase-like protein
MSSHSPADTITDLFTVIDSSEWERLGDVFVPDAVYRRPGFETMHGLDRIAVFYEHGRRIASGVHTLAGIVTDGRRGACWGRLAGRLVDGEPIEVEFADVYTFAGSRISERTSYFHTPMA